MPDNLPARIDRAAIDRVIQRATELQTGERDIGDGLTPDEIVALGKEVGIPERYLRQALIEERGRALLPAARGLFDRIFGPGEVSAQRVVRGEATDVRARLLDWMDRSELLTVQRTQPERIVWEPARGVGAVIRKSSAVFAGNRTFMLSYAHAVTAEFVSLEPGYCHVTLSADLKERRGSHVAGAVALAGSGCAASAALVVMSPFWLVVAAPLPITFGLAWLAARLYRPVAERTQLGLERALDQLEHGTKAMQASPSRTGGILGAVLDEVRRTMK